MLVATANWVETLEELVSAGRIRSYGWSTDQPHRIRRIAQAPNCSSVEIASNVLDDSPEIVPLLADLELVAFIRSPLAMGLVVCRSADHQRLASDSLPDSGSAGT